MRFSWLRGSSKLLLTVARLLSPLPFSPPREVPCSALKGETVPDSLPATPKSPPLSGGGGKPSFPSPSAGDLRELPRVPLSSSQVATQISWSPLSGLKGVRPSLQFGERMYQMEAQLEEKNKELQRVPVLMGRQRLGGR